jgi:hypothetical protein
VAPNPWQTVMYEQSTEDDESSGVQASTSLKGQQELENQIQNMPMSPL